jgi:hypothetical protein
MVMFERYRKDRALELLKQTTRRLMSTLGEANAQSIAIKLIDQYERLDVKQRYRYFDFLASDFNPEPAQVKAAAERYASDSSPGNLMALFHAVESPRQELLRRINRAPNGTHSIVKMREALLTPLKDNPSWVSTDADMRHLLLIVTKNMTTKSRCVSHTSRNIAGEYGHGAKAIERGSKKAGACRTNAAKRQGLRRGRVGGGRGTPDRVHVEGADR